jgi:glycosyltransferase involved in cell wall biosynthesis
MRRALFVQYTNPAGYPPLEHLIAKLLEEDWSVRCLGVAQQGAASLRIPLHPNLTMDMTDRPSRGIRQKLHYVAFCFRSLWLSLRWHPDLVYVSDSMAAPAGLLTLLAGHRRLVYHEHDTPKDSASGFQALIILMRRAICRRATWVVVPNHGRARIVATTTNRKAPVLTVFNCPGRSELSPRPTETKVINDESVFWLYFHGSIVPDRLPPAVIDALALLPNRVHLRIAGYETAGSIGYVQALQDRARGLNVLHRVEYVGAIPNRNALLKYARDSHLGLSLMPLETDDINMKHMVGASNKPFDYLACSCPLVVSDLAEWREMYVDAGLASACDPKSPDSIAQAVRYWLDDRSRYFQAQIHGLHQIETQWNYEMQSAPLRSLIEDSLFASA